MIYEQPKKAHTTAILVLTLSKMTNIMYKIIRLHIAVDLILKKN